MKSKANVRRSVRSRLLVEELEARRVLSGMQPTAAEQLFLEQLNDIRANPAAYGASIGVDLSAVAPAQPLAFDPLLIQADQQHAQDMNDRAYLGQNTPDNIDPGQRLTALGFPWSSFTESVEGGTAFPDPASVLQALITDSGVASLADRNQLLSIGAVAQTQTEVGIGIVNSGSGPLANYYSVDTAATNDSRPFLTGVVFQDNEHIGHYDVGEGVGNVVITASSGSTIYKVATWGSGGYSIQVNPGTYALTASGGGLVAPVTMTVTVGTVNARANFVLPTGSVQPQSSAWVTLLYQDLLGRVPSGSEVANWTTGTNLGASHSTLAGEFVDSAEYSTRLVAQWFQQYLHRAPDAGGLAGFVSALESGVNEDTIRATILASPEYFAQHGVTALAYVLGLYQDLFGRVPGPNEANNWILAASTGNLAAVAVGLLQSQEFRTDQVNAIYATYLRRNADGGGLNHFVQQLGTGADERSVIQSIVASTEYFNSSQNILWLQGLYRDVLGRGGDNPQELGNLLAQLNHGADRTGLAAGFLSTPEKQTRIVLGLYTLLLGRQADAGGLHTFLSLLQSTGHANDIIVQLASSPEFYALHLNNNTQFIRGLYQDLLGRGASQTEVDIWLNKLNTGETRAQVVTDFLATAQYQQYYITSLFNLYLQRAPSKMEIDLYMSKLQASGSDAAIVASILASNEYILDAENK
jgi:hypothetical protein